MRFRFANLKLFAVSSLVAVTLVTNGQQSTEPILFSTPDNGGAGDLKNVTGGSAPDLRDMLPSSSFNTVQSAGEARMIAPLPIQGGQVQKLLDDRKNWVFMTPAEILGVATPEKILNIPDRDASGQRQNLTPQERYIQRQTRKTADNTPGGDSDLHNRNSSSLEAKLPSLISANLANSAPVWNQLETMAQNNSPDNNWGNSDIIPNNNAGPGWSKFSGTQAAATAPNFNRQIPQQTDMDRFKQLLEPQTPVLPVYAPPVKRDYASQSSGDSIFGSGDNNGLGIFTPANGGAAMPSGLAPLPKIFTPKSTQPEASPAWAPKPPPWLSKEPQPFQMPQRKF